MNLFESVISLVAPFDCLGCGREGSLLCSVCCNKLDLSPLVPCRAGSNLNGIQAFTQYSGLAKELVQAVKFNRARTGTELMVELIAGRWARPPELVIVPVTTAVRRQRQRGYDQAVLMAKALAELTGNSYVDVLRRTGNVRQLGAGRSDRLRQIQGAYRVTASQRIADQHILLVDDVITTGATLEVAALALRQAGAKTVNAVVFAVA